MASFRLGKIEANFEALVWLLPQLFSSHADAAVFMSQPVADVLVCAASLLLLLNSLRNLDPKQNIQR